MSTIVNGAKAASREGNSRARDGGGHEDGFQTVSLKY